MKLPDFDTQAYFDRIRDQDLIRELFGQTESPACGECGEIMIETRTWYVHAGGEVPVWKCANCGRTVIREDETGSATF